MPIPAPIDVAHTADAEAQGLPPAIPEPETLALLGLAGFAALRRRQQKSDSRHHNRLQQRFRVVPKGCP
jgi:hypothetical protein